MCVHGSREVCTRGIHAYTKGDAIQTCASFVNSAWREARAAPLNSCRAREATESTTIILTLFSITACHLRAYERGQKQGWDQTARQAQRVIIYRGQSQDAVQVCFRHGFGLRNDSESHMKECEQGENDTNLFDAAQSLCELLRRLHTVDYTALHEFALLTPR